MRQQPVLERPDERIGLQPALDGALPIGFFATGDADDLSDGDVLGVVVEGRFHDARSVRRQLRGAEAPAAWDDIDPGRAEAQAVRAFPLEA